MDPNTDKARNDNSGQDSIRAAIDAAIQEAEAQGDDPGAEDTAAAAAGGDGQAGAAAEAAQAAAQDQGQGEGQGTNASASTQDAAAAASGGDAEKAAGGEAEAGQEAGRQPLPEFEEILAEVRGGKDAAAGKDAGGDKAGDSAIDPDLDRLDIDKALPKDLVAPKTWSKPDQDAFSKLPAESRRFMLRREQQRERDYTKKTMEVAPLRRVIDSWQPYFEAVGTAAPKAIDVLLSTEMVLRTGSMEQKAAVISNLVGQYGVSLEALGVQRIGAATPASEASAAPAADAESVNGTGGAYLDPDIAAAVTPLQEQLGVVRDAVKAIVDDRSRQTTDAATQQLRAFSDQKTEAGHPAHPHFDRVLPRMVELAHLDRQANRPIDLKDIYDRACWSDPEVRGELIEAKRRFEENRAQLANKQRIKKVQQASLSLAPDAAERNQKPMTLRETIEANMP